MIGKYIVCDGPDFAGKTTIINLLEKHLKSKNINSVVTKHPGSTWIGKQLRSIVKDPDSKIMDHTRAMIFAVDNAAFQEEIAKPMADSNDWLLADRQNFISACAYQIADGVSLDELKQIHSSLLNPRKIDHVFILDINFDTRTKRRLHREALEGVANDYYERDSKHFDKLRDAYLSLASMKDPLENYVKSTNDELNIHYINANVGGEEILKQIVQILDDLEN